MFRFLRRELYEQVDSAPELDQWLPHSETPIAGRFEHRYGRLASEVCPE